MMTTIIVANIYLLYHGFKYTYFKSYNNTMRYTICPNFTDQENKPRLREFKGLPKDT